MVSKLFLSASVVMVSLVSSTTWGQLESVDKTMEIGPLPLDRLSTESKRLATAVHKIHRLRRVDDRRESEAAEQVASDADSNG